MPFLLSQGAEPIPGYKLVKKLGVGGYGEVWEATAPSGLAKAIKIIFGQTGDARAEQELKALNRIKEVRHPFLLSLERFETSANQVVIVMELADASLMDRYEECRHAGLPGIPRDELLQYLRDAADALDYMNEHYGLQHLDIKPQNLLLVGRRIKIADFGLVKDLCGTSVTATGGVTPLYASPEAFDGKVSRFSDQYSLAIVYQEMLTGYRPFPGKTTLQLAFQHVHSRPLLDPLPASDRPIIARALSKSPEQRFPTCRDLVETIYGIPPHTLPPPAAVGRASLPDPQTSEQVRPPTPQPTPSEAEDNLLALDTMVGLEPSSGGTPPTPVRQTPAAPRPRPPCPGETRLRPTLFLGIGGLAGMALRRLRHRLYLRFGDLDRLPVFQFLLLDTDRTALRAAQQGKPGEAFTSEETLPLPLHRPEHYRARSRDLLQWLDRRWLYGIPRSQLTEGMRSLGRLAFVDHADEIHDRLRRALARLHSPQARAATTAAAGLDVREDAPRVFLVAAISGGTGGGMVFDAACAVRQALAEYDPEGDALCALLLHATGQTPTEVELARVNAYAALTELHHFSQGQSPFPPGPPQDPALSGERPFDECYLLLLGDHLDEARADAATDALAEYLFANTATSVGAVLDQYRAHRGASDAGMTLRTFGLSQIVFPRHLLAETVGHRLCHHLVLRWLGTLGPFDAEVVKEKALDRLATAGLTAEALTDRLHTTAKRALGQDPESFFQRVFTDWAHGPAVRQRQFSADETVRHVQAKIRSHLGGLAEPGSGPAAPPTLVESALQKQALELGEQQGREMVDWLRSVVEDPDGRLQAAERSAGCLTEYLTAVMDSARTLVGQYRAGQEELREKVIVEWTGKGTGTWFGKGRRQADGRLGLLFLEWCWLRLKELVLDHTLIVFKGVSSRISQFNQELLLCRERLEYFAATLAPAAVSGAADQAAEVPGRTELFPEGAQSLREAADALFQDFPGGLGLTFDRTFQAEVLAPRGGLWAVVSKHFNPAEVLREELDSRCGAAVLELIHDLNAADLFLESVGREEAGPALRTHLEQAVPPLAASEGVRHYVVAVPAGRAGDTLKELVGQVMAETPATVLRAEGDILVCCEAAGLAISQIAGALIGPEASYREIARQVLTRTDVRWTPLPV
jgi:serine/threonine protein kinase